MEIRIVGDGPLGATLASLWSADRHNVVIGGLRSVVDAAEVVILLDAGLPDDIEELRPSLAGKVLIDATNSSIAGGDVSFAEKLAQKLPDVHIVKVANAVSPDALRHAFLSGSSYLHGAPVTIFYCGDDAEAKLVVAGLIGEAGLDPLDAGPLRVARLLEPLGNLFEVLARGGPDGRVLAINAIRETPQGSPIDAWM